MNILLVEDNLHIAEGLKFSFLQNNYNFTYVLNKKDMLILLEKTIPDLIILDVNLPDANGFDLYKEVIHPIRIPTIFLTARHEEFDIVNGLTLGAEDYITKPFSTKELLVRVNKVLMRNKKNTIIQVKDIQMDISKMIVYKNHKNLEFTALELKILEALFLNINKIVRRNSLLEIIWLSTGNDVDDHTLTVYLKRIREKIGTDIIKTIKGIGYRIDKDEE